MFTIQDVLEFVQEEDVKFIRLAFFDCLGKQKNISIQPTMLSKAFHEGIELEPSLIAGYEEKQYEELFLKPDPNTMSILPWRSIDGAVIRLYCNVYTKDGLLFKNDPRNILKYANDLLIERKLFVQFKSEIEFYLFKEGKYGLEPLDQAGYMDLAPEDQGENVRRDICLTLADMSMEPESSHHEQGPGQNEVDFHLQNPIVAADNAATLMWVVKAIADSNGLVADFSPKPIEDEAGNAFDISVCLYNVDACVVKQFVAGILAHIEEMALFFETSKKSYKRTQFCKAPEFISWSRQDRYQLILLREYKDHSTIKVRLADPECNVHLVYSLLILAGLDGIDQQMKLSSCIDLDLYHETSECPKLPRSLKIASELTENSAFIKKYISQTVIDLYLK